MTTIGENTIVVSAEPAQTIVWTMPARGSAVEPGGYLQRVDVVGGALNDIVNTYGADTILVVGSMPVFVDKVYTEIKDANTTNAVIESKVL